MLSLRLTRSDLIALTRKYRVLSELRRAHDPWSGELHAPLLGLAREFPGALRELDLLALDEIERRLEALERAVVTGTVDTWMLWMHAYHQEMRAAVHLRRRLAGRKSLAEALARELADEAARESGVPCDPEFVMTVARLAGGAVHVVVLERLGRELGTPAATIRRALFPRARARDAVWARI